MGVPVHDDLGIRERGIERLRCGRAELVAVRHDDIEAVEPQLGNPGEDASELHSIGVAVHRSHGRYGLELRKQVWGSDVTGMQDPIDLREGVVDLGAEEAVGIGDYAETHQPSPDRAPRDAAGPLTLSMRVENAPNSSAAWKVQWPYRSIVFWVSRAAAPAWVTFGA